MPNPVRLFVLLSVVGPALACATSDGDRELGETGPTDAGGIDDGGTSPQTDGTSGDDAPDPASSEGTSGPPGDDGTTSDPPGGDESSADDSSGGDMVCTPPPDSLDVLFIGNSYTYTFDLPGLVATLGEQTGLDIHTEGLTTGGENLEYHLNNPATAEAIAGGDWDVIVLQGHSLDTVDNLEGFLEAGQALVQMIEDAGAEPLLYETWARKEGNEVYENDPAAGGTPEAMQAIIRAGYQELSDLTGAAIAPVGDTWEQTIADHPDIDLFDADYHHPSIYGAYLSANVFYAVLTDVTPLGNVGEPPGEIDDVDATALQTEADAMIEPACRQP